MRRVAELTAGGRNRGGEDVWNGSECAFKSSDEILRKNVEIVEEKIAFPQFQGFLFPKRKEPLHILTGGIPVEFGDPPLHALQYPIRIDIKAMARPWAVLIEGVSQQTEIRDDLFIGVPDKIVPIPSLRVPPGQQGAQFHPEAGLEGLGGHRGGHGEGNIARFKA